MKEFETPAVPIKGGLRPFGSQRNSGQFAEFFNLAPTEGGCEAHEALTDLNVDGVSWGGLGKMARIMSTDDITINVSTMIELEDVSGVTVYLDGTSEGTTDSDGNITIEDVTVGIHDIKLTITGFDDGDDDVIYNDYIIVEPIQAITINVESFFGDEDITGVEIYLDGKWFGKTDGSGNVSGTTRPGVHKVRLVKPGWLSDEDDVIINDYITVTAP
ncbi:MAG: carboxypeptidase-like regulatory domain-containing protein [Gammaproteobacteria bacterium]|nr:carboxypeptidase-like regulatory domain-containing protein [Gammaproteobacteria bacterium]